MSDKAFYRFLFVLVFVLMALTVAHMVYALNAYHNSSIISYIAKEIW